MQQNKLLIIGCALVFIIIVALVGVSLINRPATNNTDNSQDSSTDVDEEMPEVDNNDKPAETVVKTNKVSMKSMSFTPEVITIKKGTVVTWTNNDSMTHTVTSDNGIFDSGNIKKGDNYTYRFDFAGTFEYHCNIHGPSMSGKIIVTEP